MEIRDKDFEKVARYFIQSRKNAEEFFIEKMPSDSPTSRLLRTKKGELFVVKLLVESFPGDKNVFHLQNEVAIQEVLRSLGFLAKRYVLIELGLDNPAKIPFAVSTYIPGGSLEKTNKEELVFLAPAVLDYLFTLHSRTISQSFGYLKEGTLQRPALSFGQFDSAYLRADIQRDGMRFLPQEKKNLWRAVEYLDQAKLFCLCHWDVTRKNTLWDGSKVHLIDWSYAHYTDPASDIAGVIFWLAKLRLRTQIGIELTRSHERYQRLGFNIASTVLFYLAQRYIEVGRVGGERYVEIGKRLLEAVPANSSGEAFERIASASVSTQG